MGNLGPYKALSAEDMELFLLIFISQAHFERRQTTSLKNPRREQRPGIVQ